SLKEKSPGGRLVARLMTQPRAVLVTLLVCNLTVNVFASSFATSLALHAFGERGLIIAVAGMSLLIMLVTEVVPKVAGMQWSLRVSPLLAFPVAVFHTLLVPVRIPLAWLSEVVAKPLRRRIGAARRSYTWDELLTAVRLARREGSVGAFEYEIFSHVLEFREKVVREIMTPSIHVVSAPVTATREELLTLFATSGRSRIPIHGDSPDDVIGILHVKDLVDRDAAETEEDLRARMRETFFIQENAPIVDLYHELQRRKIHVAVVIDEHASFAGVVTTEDILEQLIGEIHDARDSRVKPYQRIDERRIVVAGTMEINDFNEVFETSIQDVHHETIAGYVLGLMGRIPREGESIEADGLHFHVISAQPNRIRKLRVEKL
ncbi:MAG TPA: hemolysin family protein, partial [Candidatus Krumholzibacteria bacterium]